MNDPKQQLVRNVASRLLVAPDCHQKEEREAEGRVTYDEVVEKGEGNTSVQSSQHPPAAVVIVSHVPPVSLAGSTTTAVSTGSSLSSRDVQPFQLVSKHGDDETVEGQPPSRPSSTFSGSAKKQRDSPDRKSLESSAQQHGENFPSKIVAASPSKSISKKRKDRSDGNNKQRQTDGVVSTSNKRLKDSSAVPLLPPIAPSPSKDDKSDAAVAPTLLAQPEDKSVLSPLHAFIRTQIEVFIATETEMSEPAPGRKHPIKLKQV